MELLSMLWAALRLVAAIQIREWADRLEAAAGRCRGTIPGLPMAYPAHTLRCQLIVRLDGIRRWLDVEPLAPNRDVTVSKPCGCREVVD